MGINGVSRLFLVLLLLLTATACWGAEIRGRSSTQLLWYNDDFTDRRRTDLTEYLRAGITNIDAAGKFSLYGYGKVNQDLNRGDGLSGRLYYLYGDYRGLYDKVDVKLGRQFVHNAAGTALIDGTEVSVRNVGPVGFSVMGGRDVIFGINNRELSRDGDYAMGLSAFLADMRNTDLEVSWFRKWDEGDVSRDLLGATFKQYLFNSVRLYGNTRFDLVTETFNELLAGVKYFPTTQLVLTGEWFQSYPTFDATSIFAVFAVNRYREGVFRVDYTINDKVAVNAGYTFQDFGDDSLGHVYHAGVGVRPIEPLKIDVEYDNRQGYNGSTNGVIVDAAYDVTKNAQVAAGFTYDVYQRDVMTNDEIARKYWVGVKCKPTKNVALSLRVENDVNARYENNTHGRFVFDYDF